MKRSIAFTLIELLVVIVIIAILAAILFPVFATAREKARQTQCASNEKQLGLAFLQYTQDFDENYPPAFIQMSVSPWTVQEVWDQVVFPYTKSKNVLTCPDDTVARQSWMTTGPRTYALPASQYNTDCIYFGCEVNAAGLLVGATPNQSQIASPSQLIMLAEAPNVNNIINYATSSVFVCSPSYSSSCNWGPIAGQSGEPNGAANPLHNGGWNYIFSDGHVKYLQPSQTVGAGIGGAGKGLRADGVTQYTCSLTTPCGYWTRADGD
ncbi:MAG: DUF1559 domain-containing protein [Capsulimonadaceae bacterium]|nr:DUF1559 domain-containing protein [Capsulimonadaceae bacterium]